MTSTIVLIYNIYEMTFSELDLFIVKFALGVLLFEINWLIIALIMLIEIKYKKDTLEFEQRKLSLKGK